jgi:hypothetical protein
MVVYQGGFFELLRGSLSEVGLSSLLICLAPYEYHRNKKRFLKRGPYLVSAGLFGKRMSTQINVIYRPYSGTSWERLRLGALVCLGMPE